MAEYHETRYVLPDGRILTERVFSVPTVPDTAAGLLAAIDGTNPSSGPQRKNSAAEELRSGDQGPGPDGPGSGNRGPHA